MRADRPAPAGNVVPLHGGGRVAGRYDGGEPRTIELPAGADIGAATVAAAERALVEFERHLDRCGLAARTVQAYRRQGHARVEHGHHHGDDDLSE